MESEEPSREQPYTETVLPTRRKERSDIADPKCAKSRTDRQLPSLDIP
jgi:hypothetical protein